MAQHSFTRREFVRLAAGGTAAMLVSFNTGCKNRVSQWRILDEEEVSLLDAIVEQIIPTDDYPGGKWANVSNYIDKQLSTYYSHLRDAYHNGLAAIQQTVMEMHHQRFESLSFAEQTAILEKMEAGNFSGEYWKSNSPSGFFSVLIDHSMQGFYGSQIHGGNREYISYRMLGLDYPNIIGQNRYNDLSWRTYKPKS